MGGENIPTTRTIEELHEALVKGNAQIEAGEGVDAGDLSEWLDEDE